MAAYGKPSILMTHDTRDVAALNATVCVLAAGQFVQQGPLDALRKAPAAPFVGEFTSHLE